MTLKDLNMLLLEYEHACHCESIALTEYWVDRKNELQNQLIEICREYGILWTGRIR